MKTLASLFGIGALLLASSASAQSAVHETFRLEPGMAVPLTQPQNNAYGAGAAATAKVDFDLTPFLDIGPSIETVQLSQQGAYGVGGLWGFGGFARLKRPHNVPDPLAAWSPLGLSSPWLDGDVQYINTGGLGRLGFSAAVGVAGPMDNDRHYWLGPFIRYTEVLDGASGFGGTVGRDDRDARMLIAGMSLEWDPVGLKRKATAPEHIIVDKTPDNNTPTVSTPPPAEFNNQQMVVNNAKLDQTIQFDFDSSALDQSAQVILDQLAEAILGSLSQSDFEWKSIQVNGYASYEGRPEKEQYNQDLSEKRAEVVAYYLINKGVPKQFLMVKGFGASNPVMLNSTKVGRKANRRVEFEISVSFIQK